METNEELQIHFKALDKTQTKKCEQRVKKKAEAIRENTQNQPCQTCINTQKENSYYRCVLKELCHLHFQLWLCFDLTVAMETSYSGLIDTYQAKLREAGEEAAALRSRLQEKDADAERWKQKLGEQQLKIVGQLPLVV